MITIVYIRNGFDVELKLEGARANVEDGHLYVTDASGYVLAAFAPEQWRSLMHERLDDLKVEAL